MTWALMITGVILCGAGALQHDAWVYLWIPGLALLILAFRHATHRADNPRPGYIINPKDQHHDHQH